MDAETPSAPEEKKGTDSTAHLLAALASEQADSASAKHAYAAAHTLAHSGTAGLEALAHVLRDWGDYGPFALNAAVRALGTSANPLAARLLLRVVLMPPADGLESLGAHSALENLGAAGAEVLADLVTTLGGPSSVIRKAAEMLGATRDEKTALGPLIAALGNRTDQNIAAGGAVGLGKLKSPAAIPALITALSEEHPPSENSSPRYSRTNATLYKSVQGALCQIGEVAIPALVQALSSPSTILRQRAAWTLSMMANRVLARTSLRALVDDADTEVRAAAVHALSNCGTPADLPILKRIKQEGQNIWLDGGSLAEIAQEAISSIEERLQEQLQQLPLSDEPAILEEFDPNWYSDPPPLEEFDPNWYSDPPKTFASDIESLVKELTAKIRDDEGGDDQDRERAKQAAHSLALQGAPGRSALIAVVRNREVDSDNRVIALDTLAETKDDAAALQPLLETLRDQDAWLAMRAASALGTLGSEAAIPHLIEALREQAFDGHNHGPQSALVRIGQASIPALLDVLVQGPQSKRKVILVTLREMSADPRVAEVFVESLGDPDPAMRQLAIEAIAFPYNGWARPSRHGPDTIRSDPAAVRALLPLLDDPEESVRGTAQRGLRAIGGPDDVTLLERMTRYASTPDNARHGCGDLDVSTALDALHREIASHLRLLARGATIMYRARAVWQATHALRRLGAPGVDALIAVLHDRNLYPHSSRVWAIDALGASQQANAVAPLLDILQGTAPTIAVEQGTSYDYVERGEEIAQFADQLRAAYALARIGTPGLEALEALEANPATPAQVRWAANDALRASH